MPRVVTALLLVAAFTPSAFAGPQATIDLDAAMAQSQATGRPILAIAGSTGCVWCKKMAGELATDPNVQEPAERFVVLLLDTDDPVRWPRWDALYKTEGDGIPAVFVVRADGKQIYGGNGAPTDLGGFLERRLEDAGTVLDDAALEELTTVARNLSRSWRRRNPQQVIAELTERLDPQNYSMPARQIAAIAEEMRTLAENRINAAEHALENAEKTPDEAFEAAVELLTVQRDYAGLPELDEALKERVEALSQSETTAPLLERASKVVAAETLYDTEKQDEAAAALSSLADEHPGTPAATYAGRILARWQTEKRPRDSDTLPPTAVAEVETIAAPEREAPGNVQRAATQLRLGRLLLSRNPGKAREYFERAIELAPGSPVAAEAKGLLNK